MKDYIEQTLIIIIILIILLASYMYLSGGKYINKISHCKNSTKLNSNTEDEFCGIKLFNYTLPYNLRSSILEMSYDPTNSKRVTIKNWKAGRTIDTKTLNKGCPEVINWYKSFAKNIGEIVGEKVKITPLSLPTSCAVLIYDEPGDFINYHFDVNYFNGRFFTVLIPITFDTTCTKYLYKDSKSKEQSVELVKGKSLIFEGCNCSYKIKY